MRTRSQARKRRQQQVRQTSVESSNLEKPDNPPIGVDPSSGLSELASTRYIFYNALNSSDQDQLNSCVKPQRDGMSVPDRSSLTLRIPSRSVWVVEKNAMDLVVCLLDADWSRRHANDAVLRNMQNQGQELLSQMAFGHECFKFVTANRLLRHESGTLPWLNCYQPNGRFKGSIYPKWVFPSKDRSRCKHQSYAVSVWRDLSLMSLPPTCIERGASGPLHHYPNRIAKGRPWVGWKVPISQLDLVVVELSRPPKAITFHLDQTSSIRDNPSPCFDTIVANSSSDLNSFGDKAFLNPVNHRLPIQIKEIVHQKPKKKANLVKAKLLNLSDIEAYARV
ncbi:hypothetical protein Tco_0713546 [Tanacetum coccineum]